MPSVIHLQDITKTYRLGAVEVKALAGVSLIVRPAELLAVMGASGSGKSTLMNIIGCLDRPSSGSYRLDGQDVARLDDDELARVRGRRIGFVFQTFNLLPRVNARDNVALPLLYSGVGVDARRQRAMEELARVGLAARAHHAPAELSGGEKQRVAIARALINDPSLILADEPTGALDSRTGADIIAVFQRLNRERRKTIVIITHDPHVAACTDRIIQIRDGRIIDDRRNAAEMIYEAGEKSLARVTNKLETGWDFL